MNSGTMFLLGSQEEKPIPCLTQILETIYLHPCPVVPSLDHSDLFFHRQMDLSDPPGSLLLEPM